MNIEISSRSPSGYTIYLPEIPDSMLRDWFAGQALAGMISSPAQFVSWKDRQYIEVGLLSDKAFNIADAMMAERAKRQAKP